jgi:transmembrane 9 superfamily protein 2/4
MQHWTLDSLPAVECVNNCRGGYYDSIPQYRTGFPLGCSMNEKSTHTACTPANIGSMEMGKNYVNNHVDILVKLHQSSEFIGSRVVGVEAKPRSINHAKGLDCSNTVNPLEWTLVKDKPLTVTYSYSIVFEDSELKWASRWDSYLQHAGTTSIHWFSIMNSLIIVVFLSAFVGVVIFRTLNRDISRYNQHDQEEAQEEFGWKLVHGDIFRAPVNSLLLSVLVGTGSQLILGMFGVLTFACLGFLSPATRGGLMTSMVILFVCLGTPAGYISARFYKMMGGELWKNNVVLTATLIPGTVFLIFFFLNLILWYQGSSAAIPFGTMIAIDFLWFFICVPLTFLGSYFGFKAAPLEFPLRTNQIPRQIPEQPFHLTTLPSLVLSGGIPFGCIFIQLFFILNSIWGHQLYYVFGFLSLAFVILVVTIGEVCILLVYYALCAENYHWWWRAFFLGASSCIYFFLYSVMFFFRRMEMDGPANMVLFIGYTSIMTLLYGVLTGTVGFLSCFAFLFKIYSVIKVD